MLFQALDDADADVRQASLNLIAARAASLTADRPDAVNVKIGSEAAIRARLFELLNDPDDRVRHAAIIAVGNTDLRKQLSRSQKSALSSCKRWLRCIRVNRRQECGTRSSRLSLWSQTQTR